MKRAALAIAFLSATALAGCGVGDAGRWMVVSSLRSAYGCSLMISSDQAAETGGELARRPEPLVVKDPSIVASRSSDRVKDKILPVRAIDPQPSIEFSALPIARDLSSIRQPGTRRVRSAVRVAVLPRAGAVRVHVSSPAPARSPYQFTICSGSKG